MRCTLLALLWLVAASIGGPAHAAPKAADLVQADLLAEPRDVAPGKPFTVAVRLRMKEGWHTYWRNPGDSGLATEIVLRLPAGFKAGPILWPLPERIPVSHLVNYGYSDEVSLLTEITPPAELPAGRPVEIGAQVSYLVCERECIPGEAALSARLAAGGTAAGEPDPATRYLFDAARARLPVTAPGTARFEPDGADRLRLVMAGGITPEAAASAYFFAQDETALDHAAGQEPKLDNGTLTLTLKRSALDTGPAPKELAGVLAIDQQGGGQRVGYQIGSAAAPAPASAAGLPSAGAAFPTGQPDVTVWAALLLAFAGGLLLNLMPCVFPVLSIKVASLAGQAGRSAGYVRLAGLAYAAGVVGSFVGLAALLLGLRAAGAQVGWGFQLQSQAVVAGLAFLLLAVGLNLSGLFEVGTGLAAAGGTVDARRSGDGHAGSFLTGVLAAIVATPCTAPFMGAAIGYAVTASAPAALAVFAALGVGMALPFVLLTFSPGLVRRLPRPGAWMEWLKQLLAFPVYATVAWLVFVLSQQVGPGGLFAALMGLVLVGFAGWTFGRTGARDGIVRRLGQGATIASLLGLLGIGWVVSQDRAPPVVQQEASGIQPFTQARLDGLLAEGRPVFVNMTAAWCVTCLVNERTTLSTERVRQRFAARDVTYLKGDWTNQNPEISRLLDRHGRSGVPLYLLYPGRAEPIILPQILTEAAVLEAIDRIVPAPARHADASNNEGARR